jgi:hypothetical protein
MMTTDEEVEVVKRAKDRIRDLIRDHVVDLEARRKGAELQGDPLGIIPMLAGDIGEIELELDRSGLGIFEQLEIFMDLVEAKGI